MNKLKGKKNIDRLFEEGVSVNLFPLRLLFVEDEVFSFGVSVGKRNFKLAVQLNSYLQIHLNTFRIMKLENPTKLRLLKSQIMVASAN